MRSCGSSASTGSADLLTTRSGASARLAAVGDTSKRERGVMSDTTESVTMAGARRAPSGPARVGDRPYRVGMIVPSSNVTMETEVPEVLNRHAAEHGASAQGFTFHSSRAVLHQVDAASLSAMVKESDRCARELADARVDVVAYACLIAIMAEGPGAHESAEARLSHTLEDAGCPCPVTSSAGALVRCLQGLGVRRIGIVAPYVRLLTDMVCGYLAGYGIEVVSSVSLEVADNIEVGRLDPAELVHHASSLELGDAEALVLSACVQMPSLPTLQAAGEAFGIPVVSAATATAAEVLALLGEEPTVSGSGAALGGALASSRSTGPAQDR
jgi:maleate isomerase